MIPVGPVTLDQLDRWLTRAVDYRRDGDTEQQQMAGDLIDRLLDRRNELIRQYTNSMS